MVIAILSLVLALVIGVLVSQWWFASSPTPVSQPVLQSSPANDAASVTTADDLIVNVVSYSEQASQRFVMLNGKMYRENDFVRAGLMVVEIRPNAVVFNVRGELITRTP